MKKHLLVVVALASMLIATTVAAQPAPYNQAGVTMGHWHIAAKDVEADKKLFLAMGGKLYNPGGQPLIMFPGLYISLILNGEKGEGGTVGSVVNHVGFYVDNVQKRTAEWKAAGVKVLPGNALPNGGGTRLDQAFVETPDGVRMEIQEDKTQKMPIGTRACSAGRRRRATTRRSWTCRACKSVSSPLTCRRCRRVTVRSITSASTSAITRRS